jgi:hypothetical protein
MEDARVSEPNLVNVWIYPYLPNEWHCQTFEGITGIGRTRDEAKATFDRDWNQRAPYHLIEGHPPRPKRPGDAAPASAAIEADTAGTAFHRARLRRFHSDLVGDRRTFTADDVLAIVNECWSSTRPTAQEHKNG